MSTLLHRLRPGVEPPAVVLMYHRVADTPCDPWRLSVTPTNFAAQLRVLTGIAEVLSADDLVFGVETGRSSRPAVVLTFDDGYADALLTVKPLLDRFRLPATLFLPSGAVDSPREHWWDELERIFLQPGTLPATLELPIDGRLHSWSFGSDAAWDVAEWERWRRWSATEPPCTARQHAYSDIWSALRLLPAATQQDVLDGLARWSGTPREARSSHRTLTAAETRRLSSGTRFQVGAHSVTHLSLPAYSREAQEAEIRTSKKELERVLASAVRHFAYPYGDYSHETATLAREAGFSSAFTADEGPVRRDSHLWRLPRYKVENWDADVFSERLGTMLQQPAGSGVS
jgi:peptidoglycan/xylan/chitin deacetylase (PgdA/CDA1 family)